jgi:peptidoglycan/xylan/chitin deacetylase (PgdA/CDA1 family)
MPRVLNYHDVVDGDDDASGFPGPLAARYKLTPDEFRRHLDAVSAAVASPPALTFDDGGRSACTHIAGELERRGWRGLFFVTTDYIGHPAFLTEGQVRDLRRRGHVIGAHSRSHPTRMSFCSDRELLSEWRGSCGVLAEILGEPVTVASVPGGYYAPAVARAAARAGLLTLYTSEPTPRTWRVSACTVLGRYTVYRGMSASAAAGLAAGKLVPCFGQWAFWNAKKAAKAVGGEQYLRLRSYVVPRTRALWHG